MSAWDINDKRKDKDLNKDPPNLEVGDSDGISNGGNTTRTAIATDEGSDKPVLHVFVTSTPAELIAAVLIIVRDAECRRMIKDQVNQRMLEDEILSVLERFVDIRYWL